MTSHQAALLKDARDLWSRGFRIPTLHAARMAKAGLDIDHLEAAYLEN